MRRANIFSPQNACSESFNIRFRDEFLNREAFASVLERKCSASNTGLQDQVGATASIDDLIDRGLVILKQLDAIRHNKYPSEPEKMAAWLTASNIQRPSASAKPANPKPAPNAKQPAPSVPTVPHPTPASARQPVLAT